MWRTLVLIPHEFAGIPVFGFGWLLGVLVVAVIVRLLIASKRGQSTSELLAVEGPMWGLLAVLFVVVLPRVELLNVDQEPVGMAIRFYGVMLVLAVSMSVALAWVRAKRYGLNPEIILSIAPWAFIGGIVGARTFYVIQYRDQFIGETLGETIGNMLDFTGGGLVVYGSFIGGFLAGSVYVYRNRLPLLKFGDVVVPCMFLGVFLGRIGCLMNGCCYGGPCEAHQFGAIEFPANSPVYFDQLRSGKLLGFSYDPETRRITSVREGSLAASEGIGLGGDLQTLSDDLTPRETASREIPVEEVRTGVIATIDGKRHRWSPAQLPTKAQPVFAAQLLSSGCALVLCFFLCGLSKLRFRSGAVMMMGFAGYAVLRFVLELVRVDEGGQFGTSLSISQWVSVGVLFGSFIGLWWIYRSTPSPDAQTQPI